MKIRVEPASDKKTLVIKFLLISAILSVPLFFSIFPADEFKSFTGGSLCLFNRLTQKPCLFCGTTHSILSSFKSEFKQAFLYNPAGIFIFLAFVFVSVITMFELFFKKRIFISLNKTEKVVIAGAIISLLFITWSLKLVNSSLPTTY